VAIRPRIGKGLDDQDGTSSCFVEPKPNIPRTL
jgi:hypothetical protein